MVNKLGDVIVENFKNYKCHKCGRCYQHKRTLQSHLNIECGKEPSFQCPHCPKRCHYKGNLKRHMIIHLNVAPFI